MLSNTLRDLNVVLNSDLEQRFQVDTTIAFVNQLALEDFFEKAEENNVNLLQADANKTINNYAYKAAKAVFLPTVGLTGFYGWNLNQNAPGPFFQG